MRSHDHDHNAWPIHPRQLRVPRPVEDLATLRKEADVSYVDEDGVEQQRSAVIRDVYAREGADYLLLSTGETVRLDRVIEAGGYKLADFPPHCEF